MEPENYLRKLPEYDFAITYGSGVFRQNGYSDAEYENAMLDIIIGVTDPEMWHRVNVALNPGHYSFARHFGASSIASLETCGLGHVYYNRTMMGPKGHERPVKYGVISIDDLKKDLHKWDSLYVSGRLQKPVRVLKADNSIIDCMNQNLRSAVVTALPLLPFNFSDRQLYTIITGLSYKGDIRTYFAESPKKVDNIVNSNFDNFKELYSKTISECPFIVPVKGQDGLFTQSKSIDNLAHITASLPSSLHSYVRKNLKFTDYDVDITTLSQEELFGIYKRRLSLIYDPEGLDRNVVLARAAVAKGINLGVRHAVFRSSVDQALKGNLSFGVLKSVSYVAKKVKKFLK